MVEDLAEILSQDFCVFFFSPQAVDTRHFDRPRAETAVLALRAAIVASPLECCLSNLRGADDDSRDEPINDVIIRMTS